MESRNRKKIAIQRDFRLIVDIHSHLYPISYIKELEKHDDGFGIPLKGMKIRFSEDVYDVSKRICEMDRCHVDRAVLSLGPPGVDRFNENLAITTAKKVNDEFARLTQKHPERFVALATLPLPDIEESLDELDRAINDLGLRGVMIFGNVAGKPLDLPKFWPLYERAAKLDVPIYIHPTTPLCPETMMDYGLLFIVGFLFDTTLAITRLIFSGVLEKYPSLKLVLAHLGSTVPYILARLDLESERVDSNIALPDQPISRVNISQPPSAYFKLIYLDTVSLHPPSYLCAHETSGPEQLLLGSDYPYWDMKNAITAIQKLPISNEDKTNILGKTASRVFKIA